MTDVSYLLGTNSYPIGTKGKGLLSEISIASGAELFFNSSVGIDFLVGYKIKNEDIKGSTGYTDKKNGFQIGIGFQIHLQKL